MPEPKHSPLPCWNCKKTDYTLLWVVVPDKKHEGTGSETRCIYSIHSCCKAISNTEPVAAVYTHWHPNAPELIIRRVNDGPEVDRRLALADELAEEYLKLVEQIPLLHGCRITGDGRVMRAPEPGTQVTKRCDICSRLYPVADLARQYLKRQEEEQSHD